jgi:hypothetical protein
MAVHIQSSTTDAIHKLKLEIDHLTQLQTDAIKSATFVGMTPDEAKEYDARRENIFKLVQQLQALEKSQ